MLHDWVVLVPGSLFWGGLTKTSYCSVLSLDVPSDVSYYLGVSVACPGDGWMDGCPTVWFCAGCG